MPQQITVLLRIDTNSAALVHAGFLSKSPDLHLRAQNLATPTPAVGRVAPFCVRFVGATTG